MSNGLQYLSVSKKTKTVLKLGCVIFYTINPCVMQFNDLRLVQNQKASLYHNHLITKPSNLLQENIEGELVCL